MRLQLFNWEIIIRRRMPKTRLAFVESNAPGIWVNGELHSLKKPITGSITLKSPKRTDDIDPG